jgi:outer membrane protein TolC
MLATYDQLALLDRVKNLLDESGRRLRLNQQTAEKAFENGLITRYEHQKIAVVQAQLDSRISAYEGKRELVIFHLHLLTDVPEQSLAGIRDTLKTATIVQQYGEIENRAELKAIGAFIDATEFKARAAMTWFVPKVLAASSISYLGLLGGTLRSSEPVIPGGQKLSADFPNLQALPVFNIGVGLAWDVFDGNAGKREAQLASIEKSKLQNDRKEIVEKLDLNLMKCRTDLHVANIQIEVKKRQQVTSWNALTQATREYNAGIIKSLQLVDAETDYQSASLDFAQAVYQQRRAAVALLLATGDLSIDTIPY